MIRMPGIGGTGVVTVSQIIGTAAMLDGFHVNGLDQTGLSQKAGPVVSDLCISRHQLLGSNKAAAGEVDLMLAFDMLGAASDSQLRGASPERTVVIGSASSTPTGMMVLNPSVAYPDRSELERRLDACSRAHLNRYVPVAELVSGLFGDTTTANVFLLGVAHQAGVLAVSSQSLERAIELNGVAVERNLSALGWGRQWIVDPASVARAAGMDHSLSGGGEPADVAVSKVDDEITMRADDLVAYQSRRYSQRYLTRIEAVRDAGASADIVEAYASNLYKLMAYKDEYEVARLLLAPEARAGAILVGGEGARVRWHLHPPMLRALGMKRKLVLGRWATPLLIVLRSARRLRGTPFDVPGWSRLRRIERALPGEYAATVTQLVLDSEPAELTLTVAGLPDLIRGYESIKLANIAAYRAALADLIAQTHSAAHKRDRGNEIKDFVP
jgi:indolepyruvate ferredoxin oxidoreductase